MTVYCNDCEKYIEKIVTLESENQELREIIEEVKKIVDNQNEFE